MKGKTMIKITDITPFMKSGWVAMDMDNSWIWFAVKPIINSKSTMWFSTGYCCRLNAFNIAPADDWTKSLIKVGGK